ncbi:hypothetical protein E4U22_007939 [Claviceps purpurea]|nr:hypothetical protein E4U22_007939 [Claviceps purpurea]
MCWRRHPQALTFSGRSGHTSADPVASTLYFPLSVLPPVVFPLFQVCSAAPNARGDKIGQPRQPTPLFLVHTFFPSRPPSTSTKPLVNISDAVLGAATCHLSNRRPRRAKPRIPNVGSGAYRPPARPYVALTAVNFSLVPLCRCAQRSIIERWSTVTITLPNRL